MAAAYCCARKLRIYKSLTCSVGAISESVKFIIKKSNEATAHQNFGAICFAVGRNTQLKMQ